MNITPMSNPPKKPQQQHVIDSLMTEPVYTIKYVGPADPTYMQPDSFTQAQVLELGIPIAFFKGPFAKLNGQKFLRTKQLEVAAA